MNKLLLVIILFFSIPLILFGQSGGNENQYNLPKLEDLVRIPNSPTAQAFAKYGSTPVNLYNGSPDIAIPLANLQGRELAIPLSLTYDASGIKVDQLSTSVGLGWNLKGGGMISRQTRGNPDDFISASPYYLPFYTDAVKNDYAFINGFSAFEFTNYPPGDLTRYFQFMDKSFKTESDKIEIQPDVYSFNALGLSGTFYIDYNLLIGYCMEHPELKIIPIFETNSFPIRVIIEWRVTDGSGNTYYFGNPETTSVVENNSIDGFKNYYSGWSLYKIESAKKKDIIEFGYGQFEYNQPQEVGAADYRVDVVVHNTGCGNDQLYQPTYTSPTYKISQSELQTISINGKLMANITGSGRQDLGGTSRISEIIVYNETSIQTLKYRFVHSYFGPSNYTNENQLRLKLDAIEVYGSSNSNLAYKYEFQYEENLGPLPPRNSFARDYWGYYNGQSSNSTFIPYNYTFDKANFSYYQWRGANRKPSFDHTKVGTLKSIKYPTGGTSEFFYQMHKVTDPILYQEEILFGGAGCQGGTQPTNPYNYCDDMIPKPPYPRGNDGAFNITHSGYYEVRFHLNGSSGVQGSLMQYFGLYRTGEINCDSNGNCNYGEPQTFCELFGTDIAKSFYGGLPAPYTFTYSQVWLEKGAYRLLLLNNDPNSVLEVVVWGAPVVESHEAGGLRISKIVDKDEKGDNVSTRYFYYGDLSTVNPLQITKEFLDVDSLRTGLLHDIIEFEDTQVIERYDFNTGTNPVPITCYSTTRFGQNQRKADQHVTYGIVTEIQFNDASNLHNGYTVFEFSNQTNSYREGYFKGTILNGRVKRKRVYRNDGALINTEQSYFTLRPAGTGGQSGFYFGGSESGYWDVYVKSLKESPQGEFYTFEAAGLAGSIGNLVEQHCNSNGDVCSLFNDSDYHSIQHACGIGCSSGSSSHPATVYYNQLRSQGKNPSIHHARCTGHVVVCQPMYNIIYCKNFGKKVHKMPYMLPRYWATTDSTRVIQYVNGGYLETVTKNFYENTNHYQITRTEFKDSKGTNRKVELSYPHELQTAEPSNPAWVALVNANRIAERIQIKSTFASNQPDFQQKMEYKSITVGGNTVYVPDVTKLSSGAGPLEPRIQIHQYDNVGNITEISKESDMRSAYRWGYNQTFPVAVVQNATTSQIFYTSFEDTSGTIGQSYTGEKYFDGTLYTIPVPDRPTGSNLVMTYWYYDGSWKFQPAIAYNPTISKAGATRYDEVRVYPQGALMTTYTYTPGLGITSVTDPNNQTTYYEYDAMGRLWLVKDFNKKIIKEHKYNYRSNQ